MSTRQRFSHEDNARLIDAACDEFEMAWKSGRPKAIEMFVRDLGEPVRSEMLRELVLLEWELRSEHAGRPQPQEYLKRFKEDESLVRCVLQTRLQEIDVGSIELRCPDCHHRVEFTSGTPLFGLECTTCGSQFNLINESDRSIQQVHRDGLQHFRLQDKLGEGATGSVWSAIDTQLERTVAVKFLRRHKCDRDGAKRLFREVREASRISHPNIARVLEVGRYDGRVYIASKFVSGNSLRELLQRRRSTPYEVAQICSILADALQCAHGHGVIHRRIKPSNIVVDAVGTPHLVDFSSTASERIEINVTCEGKVLTPVAYMAPEQVTSKGGACARSDIYSLGVVMYEMLSGELPFRGTPHRLIHHMTTQAAADPSFYDDNIPSDLAKVCLKCIEKNPRHRYQTAGEVRDELRRFLRGEAVSARSVSNLTSVWRWCRRRLLLDQQTARRRPWGIQPPSHDSHGLVS